MKRYLFIIFTILCTVAIPQSSQLHAEIPAPINTNITTNPTTQPEQEVQATAQVELPTPPVAETPKINIPLFEQMKKNLSDLFKAAEILDDQQKSAGFLKQNITIVELNELIKRVQEDLKRFDQLDRSDKTEILKIIKEKEQILLKQFSDMEIVLLPNSQPKKPISFLTKSAITIGVLLLLGVGVASYNNADGAGRSIHHSNDVSGLTVRDPSSDDSFFNRLVKPTGNNFCQNVSDFLSKLADLTHP